MLYVKFYAKKTPIVIESKTEMSIDLESWHQFPTKFNRCVIYCKILCLNYIEIERKTKIFVRIIYRTNKN